MLPRITSDDRHRTLYVILDETHDTPFQMTLVQLQYKNKERKTTMKENTIVNEQQNNRNK